MIAVNTVCHQMMKSMTKPRYAETANATPQLIDPGLDLNMEGGMGELVY